jgi:hypothetical protein
VVLVLVHRLYNTRWWGSWPLARVTVKG